MATNNRLPVKLNKEPLIDAIFEVRFNSASPASGILPGFLYSQLVGNKAIISLAASQFPKAIRDADPNLKFAPISRLEWNDFLINISDRSMSVSCKLPYMGWKNFKPAIIQVLDVLKNANIIGIIERYSMKYVDLIQSNSLEEQVNILNFDLKIAGLQLKKDNFQIRVEVPRDNFIHAIKLISSAKITLPDGTSKEGVVVDVDTIFNIPQGAYLQDLLNDLPERLDHIHIENKTIFFACLKPETITALEPTYDE